MEIEQLLKSNKVIELNKKTVLNLMYTEQVISEAILEVLKPFEISSEQFNVLRILRGQNGNPTHMSTIQDRMIAKKSNTTRLVDKLLIKGLVTRVVCSENRRKMEVSITPKGMSLLEVLDPIVDQKEHQFSNALDHKELETLNLLLEKYRSYKNE